MSEPVIKPLVLLGATAVGKTRMALELAALVPQIEIISADSRQIYRQMNLGTAKPTAAELAQVRHYFIDIKEPDESYNAGEYGQQARLKCRELLQQGKIPLIVGGSGLYLHSLADGLFQGEASDPELKEFLQQRVDQEGLEVLYRELQYHDPEAAHKIHPNDRQRVVRALEVWYVTGETVSKLRKILRPKTSVQAIWIGLDMSRQILYRRIEDRVDDMIRQGLFAEIKNLRQLGYSRNLQSQKTVGYQEIHAVCDGEITLTDAVIKIKCNTRRFAKRQMTWFKHDPRIRWFEVETVGQWLIARQFLTEQLQSLQWAS